MRHVHGVEIWTVECRCLGSRSRPKLVGSHRYRRNSQVFQAYCVVQTARCTRPSIGQCLDNSIDSSKLLNNIVGGGLCECRFRDAHNIPYLNLFPEQVLQSIQEEATTRFANIHQTNGPALQALQARWVIEARAGVSFIGFTNLVGICPPRMKLVCAQENLTVAELNFLPTTDCVWCRVSNRICNHFAAPRARGPAPKHS